MGAAQVVMWPGQDEIPPLGPWEFEMREPTREDSSNYYFDVSDLVATGKGYGLLSRYCARDGSGGAYHLFEEYAMLKSSTLNRAQRRGVGYYLSTAGATAVPTTTSSGCGINWSATGSEILVMKTRTELNNTPAETLCQLVIFTVN